MPGTNEYFLNSNARLWTQLDGPGSTPVMINCVDIGDADEPQGDVAREMCPDPILPGVYNVAVRAQGAPGEVSLQFTVPRGRTSDYLDTIAQRRCRVPFHVLYAECAARDDFPPFDVAEDFYGYTARWGMLTSKGRTNQGSALRDGGTPAGVMRTYTLSFESLEDFFRVAGELIPTTAAEIARDISSFNREICGSGCGAAEYTCDHLVMAVEADAAATADVWFSANGGQTWVAGAADPYGIGFHVGSAKGYERGYGTYRVFAVNGISLGAAVHMDASYSDDLGATWTANPVGAVDTECVTNGKAFCIIHRNLMFIVTDGGAVAGGNIYRGTSEGTAWELVGAGSDELNAVDYLNDKELLVVGDTNEVLHTIDGGDTWETITGPAAQAAVDALSCVILTTKHWLVGYEDGEIWQTFDGGTNWEQVVINLPVAGATLNAVHALQKVKDHCVWAAIQYTSGGSVYGSVARNLAGGASNCWEHNVGGITATLGYQGLWACGYNKAFAAGGLTGGVVVVMSAANA